MKKALISLITAIAALTAAAQDTAHYQSIFGHLSSSWHVARFIHSDGRGGARTTVLSYTADSALHASGWHPILDGPDTVLSLWESPDRSRLFLRYPGDSTAHLLMDLNLLPGDTLYIPFAAGPDTLAIVDNVYHSGGLKHIRTTLALPFSPYVGINSSATAHSHDLPVPLTLIEGVGPSWGLDFSRQSLDSLLAVTPLLLCHFRDSARTYHQTVDTDYPRPDGSPNDPCSVEYIRYKSVFGKESSDWYILKADGAIDAGRAYTKIFNYSSDSSETETHPITVNDDTILFLRESHDRSKLFGREHGDSTEHLIMNLNLHQGDTFVLHHAGWETECTVDTVYYVNGMKYISTDLFYHYPDYAFIDEYVLPMVFIEGIGPRCGFEHIVHDNGGFYPESDGHGYTSILLCCYKDGQKVYHNDNVSRFGHPDDTCIIQYQWHHIDTIAPEGMALRPNPVSDFLTINNLPQKPSTITIQDSYGRAWMTLAHTGESVTLNLSHLPPQIYFITISNFTNTLIKKIIKL